DLRNAPPLELPVASAEIEAVSTAFHKLMSEVTRQRAELEAVTMPRRSACSVPIQRAAPSIPTRRTAACWAQRTTKRWPTCG
ncbi:hypothetical protein, partial [Klebsiella pneumoniae]|uniref:hypothetical protein n=1 Tax=Klebsiella pneumoniae TaxID=573 RepID=UPI003B986F28